MTTGVSGDIPPQTQHLTKGRSLWIKETMGSMTQTTTTVSAGMPARMQKSMDRGTDTAPQCSLVGRLLAFLVKHDDLADHCVMLVT